MELGSVEAIKELVGAGLGCAVLPRMAMRRGGGKPAIVVRPLLPPLRRTLAVVMRCDKLRHMGLRETLTALQRLGRK